MNQNFVGSEQTTLNPIYENLQVLDEIQVNAINYQSPSKYIFHRNDWILNELPVNDLIIRNDAAAYGRIYSKLADVESTVRASRHEEKSINTEEITLQGSINGYPFDSLLHDTLKINEAEQVFESTVNFNSLITASVQTNAPISGMDLSHIVRIDTGNFWIDQDIRFIEPVHAYHLVINDRFDHISIKDHIPDVIFYRSSETQQISQLKLDTLILGEPILLRGHIVSKSLERMKPIVSINDNLELHGDYQITGNVSIAHLLNVQNLIDATSNFSAVHLHKHGIRLSQNIINVPLQFARELRVGNLNSDTLINEWQMSSLVKTNSLDVQSIIGEKVFHGDVHVKKGNCDAVIINGVNLDELNRSIVKRSAKDQTITGTIRLRQIVVDE